MIKIIILVVEKIFFIITYDIFADHNINIDKCKFYIQVGYSIKKINSYHFLIF